MKHFNHKLSEKLLRMVEDDTFFDVTKEEVSTLLTRMSKTYPRENVIYIRIKYDLWIDDGEKRFMQRLGIDYENHHITTRPSTSRSNSLSLVSKSYRVNGYTEKEWQMLTDETYSPCLSSITAFINRCEKIQDLDALHILKMKYQPRYDDSVKKYLLDNGIPLDTEIESCSSHKINGKSYFLWKLLYDDDFTPYSRGVLLSALKRLRQTGYEEDAEVIEQKYLTFLYPDIEQPANQAEVEVAQAFFRGLFPNNPRL